MSRQLEGAAREQFVAWIRGLVDTLERRPPSAHRDQALALLRQDLERYKREPPKLRLIEGGRDRRESG